MASNEPPDLPRGLVGRGGTPVSKSARLPSVRTPRDLTLGGVQKKTFKPVIPLRPKEKTKSEDDVGTSGAAESDRGLSRGRRGNGSAEGRHSRPDEGGRGRGGRGRGLASADLVQSHSIFEQGPAEKLLKRSLWSDGGSHGGDSSRPASSVSSSGTVRVKQESANTKATQEILDKLLRDDFLDDEELGSSSLPVKLPLFDCPPEASAKVAEGKAKVESVKERKYSAKQDLRTCSDLFAAEGDLEGGELLLVQLPDCLPGMLASAADEARAAAASQGRQPPAGAPRLPQAPDDEGGSKSLTEQLQLCRLTDLADGRIGKLQFMKSGCVRLMLGGVAFNVEMGTPCGFLQDVVALETSGGEQNNDMAVLGHIRHKLVISPDVDKLLFALPP